jgi:pyridoxamine 5'-phosphate oxidase
MLQGQTLRDLLRDTPTLTGSPPPFPAELPPRPGVLHERWLRDAIAAGVPEPHAIVLSTADDEGRPSGRVVALKDITADEWSFAASPHSRKGREIAVNPSVALTSYWPSRGRQVRVVGEARRGSAERSQADLAARPAAARAMALLARQSEPLDDPAELQPALTDALQRLEDGQQPEPDAWVTFHVTAREVEFWQSDPQRLYPRVQYVRHGGGWHLRHLWP